MPMLNAAIDWVNVVCNGTKNRTPLASRNTINPDIGASAKQYFTRFVSKNLSMTFDSARNSGYNSASAIHVSTIDIRTSTDYLNIYARSFLYQQVKEHSNGMQNCRI